MRPGDIGRDLTQALRRLRGLRRSRRELVLDLLLWAALSLTVATIDGEQVTRWEDLFQTDRGLLLLGCLLLVGATVAVGRAAPDVALTLSVLPLFGGLGRFSIAMAVISYLAGLRLPRVRPAVLAYCAAVILGTLLGFVNAWPDLGVNLGFGSIGWFSTVMSMVFFSVLPWLAGRSWRQYRALVRAGWERAELLEREQRMQVAQARLRERARIAHDVHDSLGHELSLLALRAGALQVDADLDPRHRAAAAELRTNAAAAAERLREVIGVLREDTDPVPTEPAGERIDTLVTRARSAGMTVTLDQRLDPEGLPRLVDRALHRIVQEGLTNAAKHAPGAPVSVRLVGQPDAVVVTVANGPPPADGRADAAASPPAGSHGLVGLRERVRLVGGTLHARPRGGGYELTATVPRTPTPAGAPAGEDAATGQLAVPSESARRLEQHRRHLRRRVAAAVAVPAALAAGIGAVMLTIYLANVFTSVLPPAEYARLRVGQERAELAAVLPPDELADRPAVPEPPAPPGAACEYYGVEEAPLTFSGRDTFRLCFRDGRLVSKDFIAGDSEAGGGG